MITGETDTNPFYNKIEALRLIYLEGFGYFEIQEPEIISDGIREVKNVTAYSLEYTLSQKYLEGIYIDKEYRNNGYAKELLYCCEQWAKDKKCVEFASDCELENLASFKFHMAMGFEEANRIICFRKML